MMKLYYSPTSPYVRKVTASLIELGLEDQVERVPMNVWAADEAASYRKVNPLGKVPALVLADGAVLFDSPVICAYLQELADKGIADKELAIGAKQNTLIPSSSSEPKKAQQAQLWQAAADGIVDACVLRFLERKREEPQRAADWIARQETSIKTTCAWFAQQPLAAHGFSLGSLSLATALGYLDLRYGDYAWRTEHEALAVWHREFCERPSLRETAPPKS